MCFKAQLFKYNKYVQERLEQIIKSKEYKDVYTIVEWGFKNLVDWVHSNLHIDLINYMVDLQVHITENTIQIVNDMVKQKVTPDKIQFYNIYHESFLLDLFTNGDLYDADNYASYADWKTEKKPETDLKKISQT